jgi:hypothetical protein
MSDDGRWGDDSARTLELRPPAAFPEVTEESGAQPAPAPPPASRRRQPSAVWKKVREPEVEPLPLTTRRVDPETVLQELRAPPRPNQIAPEELASTMDVHPWDVVDVRSVPALPGGGEPSVPLPALPVVRGARWSSRRGWLWLGVGIFFGVAVPAAAWLWVMALR